MGKFTDGQMVSAREARLEGLSCRLVLLDVLSSYISGRSPKVSNKGPFYLKMGRGRGEYSKV